MINIILFNLKKILLYVEDVNYQKKKGGKEMGLTKHIYTCKAHNNKVLFWKYFGRSQSLNWEVVVGVGVLVLMVHFLYKKLQYCV